MMKGEILMLCSAYEDRLSQQYRLLEITNAINSGFTLEQTLDLIFDKFDSLIPYDRIGFSLLEDEGKKLVVHWARSRAEKVYMSAGYSRPMTGSSLQIILENGKPRIINDLEDYLENHPDSDSTRIIVKEGIRSSLTCPLVAEGKKVGFIFFSSMKPATYKDVHVDVFLQLAAQLSMIIEKGRLAQELINLNQLKNKFLGIAAHDLRSPISVFRSYLALFRDGYLGPTTEKQEDIFRKMDKGAAAMLALIDNVLDISAIESGNLNLNRKLLNLREFLLETHENNSLLAKGKSIVLNLEIDDDLPEVEIDTARMTQVLNNLISNALKFSHPGTTITMSARRAGNEVHIAVKDQGQGIPPEERSKLFNAFSKTSVKPTSGEKSTGLGLAIVKKMVEAHGGKIWFESEVGQGSTFVFSIPLN